MFPLTPEQVREWAFGFVWSRPRFAGSFAASFPVADRVFGFVWGPDDGRNRARVARRDALAMLASTPQEFDDLSALLQAAETLADYVQTGAKLP